jgi:hypothetical protein
MDDNYVQGNYYDHAHDQGDIFGNHPGDFVPPPIQNINENYDSDVLVDMESFFAR